MLQTLSQVDLLPLSPSLTTFICLPSKCLELTSDAIYLQSVSFRSSQWSLGAWLLGFPNLSLLGLISPSSHHHTLLFLWSNLLPHGFPTCTFCLRAPATHPGRPSFHLPFSHASWACRGELGLSTVSAHSQLPFSQLLKSYHPAQQCPLISLTLVTLTSSSGL